MLGEIVKKYRIKRGLSLSKLAELAGVDKSYLSSIERKKDLNPPMQFLEKVSPVLEVSIDTLLSECSFQTYDPFWNEVVTEALEIGLTTEEYIHFLEYTKRQSAETRVRQLPIYQHLKTFLESQKLGSEARIS
ncbi:helix-turn-helix domain-containing protein [Halalkalibacter kiskunsagensis]|uniref:Helix-turn-helix domain-containing protein n=1 Tax=Halalkalibacter kiskunsagensis TaxID=1548599 RepID=A0ABV6KF71_9BACI